MFGLMNAFHILSKSPEELKREEQQRYERIQQRLTTAVPWDPNVSFKPHLTFKADTYKVYHLFNVEPTKNVHPDRITRDEERVLFEDNENEWMYCEKILPKASPLFVYSGSKRGTAMFDGDVIIPAIHRRRKRSEIWGENPYMSLTPNEIITLRPGTKKAKGHVVIGGLGLGYQLVEVSKKKNVKKITLIEISQSIVDNILPKVLPLMGRPLDEVIVGDVYKELPKIQADVALIDIFKGYGNNDAYRLNRECVNIKDIWIWGAARIKGEDW